MCCFTVRVLLYKCCICFECLHQRANFLKPSSGSDVPKCDPSPHSPSPKPTIHRELLHTKHCVIVIKTPVSSKRNGPKKCASRCKREPARTAWSLGGDAHAVGHVSTFYALREFLCDGGLSARRIDASSSKDAGRSERESPTPRANESQTG